MSTRLRRFQVASVAAAAALVVVVAAIAWWQVRRADIAVADGSLHAAKQVADLVFDRELDEMESRTQSLAANPAFVGYVSQALEAGAAVGARIDSASIADLLQERRTSFGFETAAVLDTKGAVIAAASNVAKFQRASSSDAMVADARETLTTTTGLIVVNGRLELVSLAPLVRGETLEALLYTANPINSAIARRIGTAAGTDIALVIAGSGGDLQVATSTQAVGADRIMLDALGDPLQAAVKSTASGEVDVATSVSMDGGTGYAMVSPLSGNRASVALLTSLSPKRFAAVHAAIVVPIGILALLGMTVLVIILMVGWRRWFLPLDQLATIAAAASRGNHDIDAPVDGTGPVSQVAVSFNVLQKKLREARGSSRPLPPTTRPAPPAKDSR